MSGSAGGARIPKQAVEQTIQDYIEKVLSKYPEFKKAKITGSYNTGTKQDFGDIDLIVQLEGTDKIKSKQDLNKFLQSQPNSLIVPFQSEKYKGKKTLTTGELVTILYPIKGIPNQFVQIDNIVSISEEESTFKNSFLDYSAEVQGLLLGLAKVMCLEEEPKQIFERLGIKNIPNLEQNQEFEFNLSSQGLTLRLVTLSDDFKELDRKDIWKSSNWDDVKKLFQNFNINAGFNNLLKEIKNKLNNKRSKNRIKGVFKSMVSIKSGEVGTAKGNTKQQALDIVDQSLTEWLIKDLLPEVKINTPISAEFLWKWINDNLASREYSTFNHNIDPKPYFRIFGKHGLGRENTFEWLKKQPPNIISQIYSELRDAYKDQLNEIKINNPNITNKQIIELYDDICDLQYSNLPNQNPSQIIFTFEEKYLAKHGLHFDEIIEEKDLEKFSLSEKTEMYYALLDLKDKLLSGIDEVKINQPVFFPKDKKWIYFIKDEETYNNLIPLLKNYSWVAGESFLEFKPSIPFYLYGGSGILSYNRSLSNSNELEDILNPQDLPINEIKILNPNQPFTFEAEKGYGDGEYWGTLSDKDGNIVDSNTRMWVGKKGIEDHVMVDTKYFFDKGWEEYLTNQAANISDLPAKYVKFVPLKINEIKVNKPLYFPKNKDWVYYIKDKEVFKSLIPYLENYKWYGSRNRNFPENENLAFPFILCCRYQYEYKLTQYQGYHLRFGDKAIILNPQDLPPLSISINEFRQPTALYPGKFKPPHRGHFEVAKQLLTKTPNVEILISSKPLEGITAEQSKQIWELYNNLLGNKLTIKIINGTPIKYVLDTIEKNQNQNFVAVYGKEDADRYRKIGKDPRYMNAKTLNGGVIMAGADEVINATDFRKAIQNKEDITKYIPEGVSSEEIYKILGQVNEVKILPPTKFHPGEKVKYNRRLVTLSTNLNKFHLQDPEYGEMYLIDDEETGQRFYAREKYISKIAEREKIHLKEDLEDFYGEHIQELIKGDIEAYGEINEYKIDLNDIYEYKQNGDFWEFEDDINKVKTIIKLRLNKGINEFKFYALDKDNKIIGFGKLNHYNPKVMNTIFKIFIEDVLPNNDKILLIPAGNIRYRLFRALINNKLPKDKYEIYTKDDIEEPYFIISKKQNITEVKINKPTGILKAFRNPSGAIYLLFNGKPKNSNLTKYVKTIGWEDRKTSKIEFEIPSHLIEVYKKIFDYLSIPYEFDNNYDVFAIDKNLFQIKPTLSYTLWDKDIEDWYNQVPEELNEIKINDPSKPIPGEIYDIKKEIVDAHKIKWNDSMTKQEWEACEGTEWRKNGWYWSKGWKYFKSPHGEWFEDILYGDVRGYDKNEEIRPSKSQPINESKIYTSNFKELILYLNKLVKFVCEDLKIEKPDIKIINNEKYTQENNSFGGYNPQTKKIYLVVKNRNASDCGRSLCHELYHFYQDSQGVLTSESGKDGSEHENQANSYAGKIMREFNRKYPQMMTVLNEVKIIDPSITPKKVYDFWKYMKKHSEGNKKILELGYIQYHSINKHMGVIDWLEILDKIKLNQLYNDLVHIENKDTLTEGRYDSISNKVSSMIFEKWKQDYENKQKHGLLTKKFKNKDVKFNLIADIDFTVKDESLDVDGGLEKIDGINTIYVNFKVDKSLIPQIWSEISMNLKDVIRHEIEHITQDSKRKYPSKYMDDDFLERDLISAKLLPKHTYFKLDKEVDANLQGMYFKAKKQHKPFIDVINAYLDTQDITPKQRKEVLNIWRTRSKELSLPNF